MVVVGAGFAGLTAARELSHRRLDTRGRSPRPRRREDGAIESGMTAARDVDAILGR
ncbi:MAG TPA: hypothetical protein VEC15_02245 [Actinomycetota bacterium]|nr:hypothetical protein [Actinomycetota bacterium]